ncbi:AraC family transcriptional regulator [Ciceribacter sp. L1K22]|uniref:AraC family transcriptional regulator n=1 Tax=Ciceribacter sp. L1K22 TaxID=2820275 RepID=UPI001ABEC756|nr:AraC family transcriptional regulator [Ciceribacter sp. L1K22]MBO3761102.1 AraC family transcriptional regulator [Ciceribacter sp. L1K22]
MTDPVSDIVNLLQPSALRSKIASGAGAWRVRRQESGGPFYCVLMEGTARLAVDGRAPVDLKTGDFVLVPAAFGFTMSSTGPAAAGENDPDVVTLLPGETRHGDPDAPADVRMLIGHFSFGSPDADLLVPLLPDVVHVRGDRRLSMIVELVTEEARAERPAREVVLERLLEVMLIEALRSSSRPEAAPGLLRGLADTRLSEALHLMHAEPGRSWTVAALAREAALSRSAFFDRFTRAVGVTPMDYLLSWRMALAKTFLTRGEGALTDIAERLGYSSASAFSVAFTRRVGVPPSVYARRIE